MIIRKSTAPTKVGQKEHPNRPSYDPIFIYLHGRGSYCRSRIRAHCANTALQLVFSRVNTTLWRCSHSHLPSLSNAAATPVDDQRMSASHEQVRRVTVSQSQSFLVLRALNLLHKYLHKRHIALYMDPMPMNSSGFLYVFTRSDTVWPPDVSPMVPIQHVGHIGWHSSSSLSTLKIAQDSSRWYVNSA